MSSGRLFLPCGRVGLFAFQLASAPAAAELRTHGSMGLDFSLRREPVDQTWTQTISTRLDLTAELFPGDRDNTRVVVQTSGWADNASNTEELSIIPR